MENSTDTPTLESTTGPTGGTFTVPPASDPDTNSSTWNPSPGVTIYDQLRSIALDNYNRGLISYPSLQQCLSLAHLLEADVTQRHVAHIAMNKHPDGEPRR